VVVMMEARTCAPTCCATYLRYISLHLRYISLSHLRAHVLRGGGRRHRAHLVRVRARA